ncbi:hypothetical protein H206_02216 [Candidatus Electrothrix aarhusensis]|uniref:Uncharacterized protein n=1 Tax=Candidatus Electrothrix aarhusensis TaxID=1859131 RepID=A0A3S3QGX9_9BACT|nr:hypothetical protein H206_02216 [Candidatus Electrothrix aarhusensis]
MENVKENELVTLDFLDENQSLLFSRELDYALIPNLGEEIEFDSSRYKIMKKCHCFGELVSKGIFNNPQISFELAKLDK